MTAVILWFARFLIAYWIIRIILLMIRGEASKKRSAQRKTTESVRRFDTKGKNISDAEFKEMP
jgi:hypothetical protein